MMRRYAVLASCLLLAQPAMGLAAPESFSLGLRAGTLGGGLEVGVKLYDDLRFRVGANYLSYSLDNSSVGTIDYQYDLDFKNLSLLFDWHIFGGALFVTGGAFILNHDVDFTGELDAADFPNDSVMAALAGTLSIQGDAATDSFSPYLGLGWRSNHGRTGLSVSGELGLLFQDEPKVEHIAFISETTGKIYPDRNGYLDAQLAGVEDDLAGLRFYPVATVMLHYNF